MQSPNKNKVIIILIALSPVIISLLVFGFINIRKDTSNPDEYYDKGSGETVSNPKNKTPEIFGIEPGEPTYLGFSKLIDAGLTTEQLDLVKSIFAVFSLSDDRYITELSVTINTIEQNISDESLSISFEITADRKTKYSCIVSYTGLSDARLVVSDSEGKQIFDSGTE